MGWGKIWLFLVLNFYTCDGWKKWCEVFLPLKKAKDEVTEHYFYRTLAIYQDPLYLSHTQPIKVNSLHRILVNLQILTIGSCCQVRLLRAIKNSKISKYKYYWKYWKIRCCSYIVNWFSKKSSQLIPLKEMKNWIGWKFDENLLYRIRVRPKVKLKL